MNRTLARKLAETITNAQLKDMFSKAKNSIKNWKKPSTVNKGMTKGVAWNILAAEFDENEDYHICAKANMIHEFGDFLPLELIEPLKNKKRYEAINLVHQEPFFKK